LTRSETEHSAAGAAPPREPGTAPATRVLAVVCFALLAAYAVGAGLTTALPADVVGSTPAGALLAATIGAILGALATGYRDPTGGARTSAATRAAEVTVLLVVARLSSLVGRPTGEASGQVEGWVTHPTTLLDLDLVVLVGLAMAAWGGVLTTLRDIEALRTVARTAAAGDQLARLVRRFLLTGLAAAAGVGLAARAGAPVVGATLATLALLIGGGVGIARVRLAALLARWEDLRVTVADDIAPRWRRSSTLLILLAVLIALLLPTPSGVGLVGIVLALVRGVGHLLEAALRWWRGLDPRWADPLETDWDWDRWDPFTDDPIDWPGPREMFPPGMLPAWAELLVPIVAGVVLVLVAVVLLRVVLSADADVEIDAGRRPRWTHRVGASLRRLRRWIADLAPLRLLRRMIARRRAGRTVTRTGPATEPSASRERSGTGPSRRPRDHRDRVLAAYTEVVRAAERRGVPRPPSHTPYEFEEDLAPLLAVDHLALDVLTEGFVEARFSDHRVGEDAARRAVRAAERVRSALERDDPGDLRGSTEPAGLGDT
jgi:hypothetical protein